MKQSLNLLNFKSYIFLSLHVDIFGLAFLFLIYNVKCRMYNVGKNCKSIFVFIITHLMWAFIAKLKNKNTSIHPYLYMLNFAKHNLKGQATVEYVLFILIMLIACSGVLKIIIIAWQYKFELISKITGAISVIFC